MEADKMSTLNEERFKCESEREDKDLSFDTQFALLSISRSSTLKMLEFMRKEREGMMLKRVSIESESIEKQIKEIKTLVGQLFFHFMNEPIRETVHKSDIHSMCKTLERSYELKRIMSQPILRLTGRCAALEKKKRLGEFNISILMKSLTDVILNARLCSVPIHIISGFMTAYKDIKKVAMDNGIKLKDFKFPDDLEIYLA